MIDIKDLQIGDLVNYRPGWIDDDTEEVVYESKTCFPIRLTCLYDGFSQYDDVLPDGSINTIEVADYEIFAIPLTPEILEKNGFEKTSCGLGAIIYTLSDDNEYYAIAIDEYTDSIWRLEYTNCEINFPLVRIMVCYVHELQHALRLCGIEKEIEL